MGLVKEFHLPKMLTLLKANMRTGLFVTSIFFFITVVMCSCGPKENEISIGSITPADGSEVSVEDITNHEVCADFSSSEGFASCTIKVLLAENPDEEVNSKTIKDPKGNSFEFCMPVDFRYEDENGGIKEYPSGTEFILEAIGCDNEDCVFPTKKQSKFTIVY